jgi:D-lactate dehydrogenase (cytochrome)
MEPRMNGRGHRLNTERARRVEVAVGELRALLGPRISTEAWALEQHSRDESHHAASRPEAVVSCTCLADVAQTLRICQGHGVPVIPFGAGTGLEGGVIPVHGGITLDLSAMNRIVRLSVEDQDVTVEPGVTLSQLNRRLGDEGLYFPIDPGSDPTIGGMAATGASGTNAVHYGTMKENTLGLTVALATGEVVTTGGRARKSAAGYDLTRLFVGSEGTLGVITEITVRVYGLPETLAAAVCSMKDLQAATSAVIQMIQLGIPLGRVELLDEVMVEANNRFNDLSYPVCPTLFLEFHGGRDSVAEQIREVTEVVAAQGAELQWTDSAAERSRLWEVRHHSLYAAKAMRPGATAWATDVCVPISRLAECIAETKLDIERSGVVAPIVGHVGDGNFHLTFVVMPSDPAEHAAASGVHERMVARALAMDGTCTGEHGIGIGKVGFLESERGGGIEVMRRIKAALDPKWIMNPGKVLASADPTTRPSPGA